MLSAPRRRFAWFATRPDPKMASVRVRMMEPLAALRARGLQVEAYDPAVGVAGYDAVIFCKAFCDEAQRLAREARTAGRAVVFDICDNVFEGKSARGGRGDKPRRVRAMLAAATHVTTSTPVLAAQIRAFTPTTVDIRIIPDALDSAAAALDGPLSDKERGRLRALERFLSGHKDALRCVWFGKSQGALAGLAHLRPAVEALARFSATHPVTLTVISNARWRYWKAALGWPPAPSFYMPWSLATSGRALSLHDVAILPVEENGYTAGKSINRAATAIIAGLGVVADPVASYEELRPFIPLGDWQGGLARYLHARPATDPRLEAARHHLEGRYGASAVAGEWARFLNEAVNGPREAAPLPLAG